MKTQQLIFHDDARLKIRRGVNALAEAVKATMAGNGTTTATVLAHGMVHEGLRYLAGGMNPMNLKRGIDQTIEAVVEELKSIATIGADTKDIAHVATISTHHDRSIGELVASAIDKVGREGAISITDGSGLVSVHEVVEGLQFGSGYPSPYFINNTERLSAMLDDVRILLCEWRLTALKDLLPLLEEVVKSGQPLLVIAEDLDSDTLAALVINNMRGSLKTCAVKVSGFGTQRQTMLQDMAILTGGKLVSDTTSLGLAQLKLTDLGRALRVEVARDSTTLIGGAGDPQAIRERIAQIRKEREWAMSAYDRGKLDKRAARLAGGVALIKVGATTETELKARKIRVEDATRTAYGYNAATHPYGDLLQMGVIDPAKLTRLALQNAASIAGLILTTDCMIATTRTTDKIADTPAITGMGSHMDMF